MSRNQSQFIKQQTFMQSLRNSVNLPKEVFPRQSQNIQLLKDKQYKTKYQKEISRSLSKSNKFGLSRKNSLKNVKINQKIQLKCIYFNDLLQFDLNWKTQSLQYTDGFKLPKVSSKKSQEFIWIKNLKILIQFQERQSKYNQKYQQDKQKDDQIFNQNIIKMQICSVQLTVQQQKMKVKKTYPIDLHELQFKKILRINIHPFYQPNKIFINQKQVKIQSRNFYFQPEISKIFIFKPWNIIQSNKILLQNKILSEKPKSKLKWNSFSIEENKSQNPFKFNIENKNQNIQSNYGLKNLNFLGSNSYIMQNMCTKTPQKETSSIISTVQESCSQYKKNQTNIQSEIESKQCNKEVKRRNLMMSSLNLNEGRKGDQEIRRRDELKGQSRSRSSFRNLKEKNDYFQMRQSDRKKSVKKNINWSKQEKDVIKRSNNALNEKEQNSKGKKHKNSEIRLEYGIL